MTRFLGVRGVAAVGALLLSLIAGSTGAEAQILPAVMITQGFDFRSMPSPMGQSVPGATAALTLRDPETGVTSGLSLAALIDANSVGELDEEANCLATAVYFESKGEPLAGQLAVAQVVMNRAASGRYPASLCGVVKQRAQFSFVRNGAFPWLDPNCDGWRKARAIARIAQKRIVVTVPTDVLWYHANYVAPRWRQALIVVERIGAHIFYRA